jgi:hypothetical protein
VKHIGLMFSMLSSILLGLIVQDFDALRRNFAWLFLQSETSIAADFVARVTAIAVIAMFLRNIHGAVRYDELLGKKTVLPSLDASTIGRVFSFACAVAALFLGPSLIGHMIIHHAGQDVIDPATHRPVPLGAHWYTLTLFFPFACFLVWDLMIWLLGTEKDKSTLMFEKTTLYWIKIDVSGLLAALILGAFALWRRLQHPFNYEFMAFSFLVIAAGIVVADYWLNREFYFPNEQEAA